MQFDWHADPISQATRIDQNYKNTQNVRRFLAQACGDTFKFNRPFMAWMKSGVPQNMGQVADEWMRLHKADTGV